jgi:1-pyrroline-4-hydroxy-2-carboxylate deaminase
MCCASAVPHSAMRRSLPAFPDSSTPNASHWRAPRTKAGCDGLMVLPPYVYRGDWRETQAHFERGDHGDAAVLHAVQQPDRVRHGPDRRPGRELAAHENVHAVKDSSGDVRRLTAYRELLGDRLALFAGLDDMAFEAASWVRMAGSPGWSMHCLAESVLLFELARSGSVSPRRASVRLVPAAAAMDTVPKFVQLIKLVQAEVGQGSETVRPPRLPLEGAEREDALSTIRERLGAKQSL